MGLDWWTHDPFFSGRRRSRRDGDDVRALRDRVAELEELVRRAGLADGERALPSRERGGDRRTRPHRPAAVPEVVAAALERRGAGLDRLADLLTDAIVAGATGGCAPPSRAAAGRGRRGAPGAALYAYGITRRPPVPGDIEALTGDARSAW